MLDLAKGIWVEERGEDGKRRRVYRQPPDKEMLRFLVGRGLGGGAAESDAEKQSDATVREVIIDV